MTAGPEHSLKKPSPSQSSLSCAVCGKRLYHINGPVKGQLTLQQQS